MADEPRQEQAQAGLDISQPNFARIGDYFLGGKDNFAADRKAAEEILAIAPEIRMMAKDAQSFQRRAVRHLVDQGVTQFINIGTGLPNNNNTHQLAQALTPDARVVYVARDPVVLSHSRALLAIDSRTGVVDGDILHPAELAADPGLRAVIDTSKPVAVVVMSALQWVPDEDDPFKRVAELRDWMPEGSYFLIVHAVFDSRPEAARPIVEIYKRVFQRAEDASRTMEQVRGFFDGFELVDPGLVYIRQWRPDNPLELRRADRFWLAGGLGRKIGP